MTVRSAVRSPVAKKQHAANQILGRGHLDDRYRRHVGRPRGGQQAEWTYVHWSENVGR